jgi:hypothetical protein
MTFWSWDDGYDGTWEGEIYGERYSDGAWHLMEGQANIETEEMDAVWAGDVGHHGPGGPYEVRSPSGLDHRGGLRLASIVGPSPVLSSAAVAQQKTPKRRFNEWLHCVAGGCGWIGLGCLSWGPLAPECWIGGCAGPVMIGCYIEKYFY